MEAGAQADSWDFFISYTKVDRAWAEWIAWELEEDGHRVLIQAWDFVPGSNWMQRMDAGIRGATRTIAVMSGAYLKSVYGGAEWRPAWARDPDGTDRKLLVVRVESCERQGLLAELVAVDLFGIPQDEARTRLRGMVVAAATGRAKPAVAPEFPGIEHRVMPQRPDFPGKSPATSAESAIQGVEQDHFGGSEPPAVPSRARRRTRGRFAARGWRIWVPVVVVGVVVLLLILTISLLSKFFGLPTSTLRTPLQAGDCLAGQNMPLGTGKAWPAEVTVVPCAHRHVAEVFGNTSHIPWGGWVPFFSQSGAHGFCAGSFFDYVGSFDNETRLSWTSVVGTWSSGRELYCIAYLPTPAYPHGTPTTGSIQGTNQ
jgi:hypothetical protein